MFRRSEHTVQHQLADHLQYASPWWLPGGHLQTIYARMLAQRYSVNYRRERWDTPDGDFIDLDWVDADKSGKPMVVLFHGLEGCSRSHYALSLMSLVQTHGWNGVVVHFRGCSGEPNRLARAYHSGDSAEIDWILRRLRQVKSDNQVFVVGVSLGGNVLLKWLGEKGDRASELVHRVVGVSVPVDLTAAALALDSGINRRLYTRHFLNSLRPKVVEKATRHGLEIDLFRVARASTFHAIDDLYTAPVHGFRDAADYWTKASSKPWLRFIAVPTLLLHAHNDPFLPITALPDDSEVSEFVQREFLPRGGHVGFVSGKFPGTIEWLPQRIIAYFKESE